MVGEKIIPVLKKASNPVTKAIFCQAVSFAAGILFAYSGKNLSYSPSGVAFVCAVREKYRIASSLGAALGYVLYCDSLNALRFIAAILCAYVMSRLLCSFDLTSTPLSLGLISAFCVFSTGVALALAGKTGAGIITAASAAEAAISFCICFLLKNAFLHFEVKPTVGGITLKELVLYSFFASLVLWAFHGFSPVAFSPSATVCFFIILFLPSVCSGLGSAVFGSAAFAVFCLLSEGGVLPFGFVIGSAACTLSYFSSKETRLRALYLMISVAILFFLRLPFGSAFILEAAAASAVFLATPEKVRKRVTDYLTGSNEPIYDSAVKKGLSARLRLASSAVGEISSAVTAVCEGLERGLPSARSEVFSRVTGELCAGCSSYESCWLENREKTIKVFDGLFKQLSENEYVDYQNMTFDAKNRCIKGIALARAFNLSFQNYTVESVSRQDKKEMRRCIAEQFYSVGDIINDIADGLDEDYCPDADLSDRIRAACFSIGLKPKRVVCKTGESGRLKIEIECDEISKEFSRTLFREKMETVCSRRLEMPVVMSGEESEYITVCEKHTIAVEVGTSQITSRGEKICGDNFDHFFDGRGSFDVVLADGMGTGARAALDSSMTRSLTKNLLKKGISPRGTLRLVNSALMVKSPEESMSSLDIMQVDMFSGRTVFFKAGAASSFIRHKGRVQEIRKSAMPLGILHRVEFASLRGSVSVGDIAVMVSDGIADCGAEMVKDVLRKNAALPSEDIADLLTKRAEKMGGEKHDDLTAVVCKFF